MQIIAYLTFSGNCREAMSFYQKCLGGELYFQTVGDSPLSDKMPKKMKDCIVHSVLTCGDIALMASDMTSDSGLIRGNSISLSIHCKNEDEVHYLYAKLSAGGKQNHPVAKSFWGSLFGTLTDKYNNQWILTTI